MISEVAIIDCGTGNTQSVTNAFVKVGANPILINQAEAVFAADRIVLPGVGAFRAAMEQLTQSDGLIEALNGHVKAGKPILGICLGMQLFAQHSSEDGFTSGLGWVNGKVVPFHGYQDLKIPHMGWNSVKKMRPHPILEGFVDDSDLYFVHSYHIQCDNPENVLLTCDYGGEFTAAVANENIIGMQFHPEKSQTIGLMLLSNFLRM